MDQRSLEFRRFMLYIGNELLEAEREDLQYYLGDVIPAGKREALRKSPSISSIFEELHRAGHIGPGNLDFLKKSLKAISRDDLANEVKKFDSHSIGLRLKLNDVNYVESSGYYLGISGGKHLVNDEGDNYVYLRSGENYQVVISNKNDHRVICEVKCDGRIIFPGLVIEPGEEVTLDRPCHTAGKLKFFAVKDAPVDSGIDAKNTEENGIIQVTFTPEIFKMTISCDIGYGRFHFVTCFSNTTDVEFHSLIFQELNCDATTVLTILIDGWKPLNKRNLKVVDYGMKDWSHVRVSFGLVGGVNAPPSAAEEFHDEDEGNLEESVRWIPGATTMQGQSSQTFVNVNNFVPNHETRKVVLQLRLVAKADETPNSFRSLWPCTPFVLGNRRPPPV